MGSSLSDLMIKLNKKFNTQVIRIYKLNQNKEQEFILTNESIKNLQENNYLEIISKQTKRTKSLKNI